MVFEMESPAAEMNLPGFAVRILGRAEGSLSAPSRHPTPVSSSRLPYKLT